MVRDLRSALDDLELENTDQKVFIPFKALQGLLTPDMVTELVRDLADGGHLDVFEQHEIVHRILNNGLRVFATLLSISRPELIRRFIEIDHFSHIQFDSRLPLPISTLRKDWILEDEATCRRFYQKQWRFLAPIFQADQTHRVLDDHTILPFINSERLGEGACGEVFDIALEGTNQAIEKNVGNVRAL